jgi:hypothetical protein
MARGMRGAGAENQLSFSVFGLCNEGSVGATDSAHFISPGTYPPFSSRGQKVYRLPDANVSIAICADNLVLELANVVTHEWPSPSSLVGRNPTFEEVVVAVQEQMVREFSNMHYDLALFSGPGPSFPRLARIHAGRVEYAVVGDIVYASYARMAQASWISEQAPNNLVALRDLVIAASSRTLRRFGGHTVEGQRVISWPIYVYTRSWLDGTTTRLPMETITEVEAKPAERRYLVTMLAEKRKDLPLHARFYDQLFNALESIEPPTEDTAEAIRRLKAMIRPSATSSPTAPEAPTPAPQAVSISEEES